MKSSYRAILFDLDGTLVRDDLEINSKDIQFINKLRKSNIEISIATGRILKAANPFIKQLNITAPVILYNGAVVMGPTDKTVLWCKKINPPQAQSALKILQEFNLDIQIYSKPNDEGFFVSEVTKAIKQFTNKDKIPAKKVENLEEVVPGGVVKFLNIGKRGSLKRCMVKLKNEVPDLTFILSEYNYLEVLPSGVSKGTGLKKWSEIKNVSLESTVAFGDNMNDLELLKTAGLGVAMATAPTAVKEVTDLTTESVEERGIRKALVKIFGSKEIV